MSVTSCLSWVPKGYAKSLPDKVKLTEEDLERIFKEELETAKEDNDGRIEKTVQDSDDMGMYNLEDYDNEEIQEDKDNDFVKLSNLATFHSNKLDSNIDNPESDMDSDEMEDWEIKETDNLLACGSVNECEGALEVYVYNKEEGSFYIHHDIMLSYLPISCEWLSYDAPTDSNIPTKENGNFLAVGGMKSFIDVWDLDIVDSVQPYYTLKHKGEKDKKRYKGVLGLAWNRAAQKVLASSSASGCVTTWDLSTTNKLHDFFCHSDKACTLAWHPEESNLLLAGSSDKSCVLLDCRVDYENNDGLASSFDPYRYNLSHEVECVCWNTNCPYEFLVASNDGNITCFDCRKRAENLFTFSAYEDASDGLSMSLQYPYLITCSANDPFAKLWDVSARPVPGLLNRKKINLKQIHSVSILPPDEGKDSKTNEEFIIAAYAGIGSSKPLINKIKIQPNDPVVVMPPASTTSSNTRDKVVLEADLVKPHKSKVTQRSIRKKALKVHKSVSENATTSSISFGGKCKKEDKPSKEKEVATLTSSEEKENVVGRKKLKKS